MSLNKEKGPLFYNNSPCFPKESDQLIAACAAASLAIGTLYGEHET